MVGMRGSTYDMGIGVNRDGDYMCLLSIYIAGIWEITQGLVSSNSSRIYFAAKYIDFMLAVNS